MKKGYVGFYWTRPVPTVGFTSLSSDAEEAAQRSRTVRYQRELTKAFVREQNGELVDEIVFLELEPDRGTEFIAEPLERAFRVCRDRNATLLYVSFWLGFNSRRHAYLLDLIESHCARMEVEAVPLCPHVIQIDGQLFDPVRHFRGWDDRIRQQAALRRDQAHSAIRELASQMPEGPGRYRWIAHELNRLELPTLTGRTPWTAENVRQIMRRTKIG